MVLETAADVENLGAAAYLGQAGNITSKDVLAAALVDPLGRGTSRGGAQPARRPRLRRQGRPRGSLPDGAFAKPMDEAAVLAAVQPFLA